MGLLYTSCIDKDLYLYNNGEEKGFNYESMENFRSITVSNDDDNSYVSVFYEHPWNDEEGAIVSTPYATGRNQFTMKLEVPTHVEKLYILKNGELLIYPVTDIHLTSTRASSYTTDELNNVVNVVRSTYLPAARFNVRNSDLYKCCDLYIGPDAEHMNEKVDSYDMTFVSLDDGGLTNAITGNIFMYLYPSEKRETLTPEDCIFYGTTDKEGCTTSDKHFTSSTYQLAEVPFDKLVAIGKNVAAKKTGYSNGVTADLMYKDFGIWPLFYSRRKKTYDELNFSLSTEFEGYNMGFCYIGGQNLRFSTPALNIGYEGPADKQYANYKGNYIGYKLVYADTKEEFIVNQNVSNGFIQHFELNGKTYNLLGMDNQYPFNNTSFYDGDYDDMSILITSNPKYLKPVEEVSVPNTEPYIFQQGYYLFEDNFPEKGDYDFNDVIIQYDWRHYPQSKKNYIVCGVAAKGCSMKNTFGFRVNGVYKKVINDITGYYNVSDETIDKAPIKTIVYEVEGAKEDITPFLYNGKGYVCKTLQGSNEYPYVLDIPYSNGHSFKWMKEGNPITTGYYDIISDGWYTKIKDISKVIIR